ncbi:hypothetical protein [Actinoplanes aureus]|uniref:Uncharacterized protein n=1 Tax=Actinoplanes aureus TaxID=2792083 RepID=A0A931CGW8_9ACTN|nr:hypothetical protein [Actinoplanes aureus]MBG0568414.1 hypothetical protein [Actinoplanes aureus]
MTSADVLSGKYKAERARLERRLTETSEAPSRMTQDEIRQLVTALGDIVTVLRNAHAEDKAEVYRQLNLRLVYDPETTTVRADVSLGANRGEKVGVRGATQTYSQHTVRLSTTIPLK